MNLPSFVVLENLSLNGILTNKAMGGNVSFREALNERLKIVQPTRQKVADFLSQHPPQFTPGIKELVSCLGKRRVPVYLVSGGFQSILVPVAEQLGLPIENIIANRLKFYYNGDYAGFDENQPTSSSGGKKVVVETLKNKHGYKSLVMIGDGATDMEACPPADAFIGFGGNIIREKVKQSAPWFVTDMQELINEIKE
ncbi:phosphoserine phosphatase-like isoform X3 [Mytilus californianus]|uniref:phosphoserine phosphatase-like isoform X3 n=1 Tax=Mytilus californianus TaxID=6549 RepID=UPI0022471EE9|nr:phosphoserine phosphatase-like isoform X3 [Mytilus californianus]